MGESYEFSCPECGYQSNMVHLGQGMMMDPELILGTCDSCCELTQISVAKSRCNCDLCQASSSVQKTPSQSHRKRTGFFGSKVIIKYECPKCRAFSVQIPEIPSESWD